MLIVIFDIHFFHSGFAGDEGNLLSAVAFGSAGGFAVSERADSEKRSRSEFFLLIDY